MHELKLVVVGDGGVGKSCLLITYKKYTFPDDYVPTVFNNYTESVLVDFDVVNLSVCDTAGQEDYDRLRPLAYPDSDVFFICFSVDNRDSLKNVESKWLPEVKRYSHNAPIVLVACKIDLRTSSSSKDIVKFEEGIAVAERNRLTYFETSALANQGLETCFGEALRWALAAAKEAKQKGGFSPFSAGKGKINEVSPPPMIPKTEKAPKIDIDKSIFGDQWYRLLQDPKHADVTFVVEGKHYLQAHTVVLCAASTIFGKIIGVSKRISSDQTSELNDIDNFSEEQLNSGAVPGIASVFMETAESKRKGHLVIELSDDISVETFGLVLEYLYSGAPRFSDPDSISDEEAQELQRVAVIFRLGYLKNICTNILEVNDRLNQWMATKKNVMTGAKMKELFFNLSDNADVVFNVGDESVYAHKCVLAARCDVMAAMFSGHFSESKGERTEVNIPDTPFDTFLAFLEYLYTDKCPIEENDAVGIMVLADEYGQHRLVTLCELYITKEVDRSVTKQIEKAEIDVIGLLMTSQMLNADQLANWCLFFIASNYIAFEKRPEFQQLKCSNKDYVEENRWPPLSYMNEVEEYNRKKEYACSVM